MQQQNKLHAAEGLLRVCLHVHTAELGATHEDSVEVLASLVEVLWQMKRVDEAAMLLGRQLELQSQQEDIDPIVLAQGYAALGALRWEASDHEAALATYLLAERH